MRQPKPVTLAGFPKGMSNLGAPYALPEGACRNLVNLDVDDAGKTRLRKGSTVKYAAADCDSLWSNGSITLFREGAALKELLRDSAGVYSARTVRAGLTPGYRIAFLDVNGDVCWSNGIVTGRIRAGVDGPWGVERPPRQPVLAAQNVGGMFAGQYQVAITYLAADGEEGGTGLAATVTVAAGGGIGLSAIPQSALAATIRVYCSMADGDVLYRYGDYPAGTNSIVLGSFQSDLALETQFGYPPPPGTGLELHNARIYIAQGKVLWPTDPFRYGLYMPHKSHFPFADEIRMHAAVSDGIYVATAAKTYFLSGMDTDALRIREVLPYGAPAGAATKLPGTDRIAWFSHRGWVLGGSSGAVKNLMEAQNAVAAFARAATLYREEGGLKQLIAIAQQGVAPAGQAKDYTDYEIARHGVAL